MPPPEKAPRSLSVLMPVYNERETVRDAIEAVLSAELLTEEVELIIVDDGSDDGTQEILAELDLPDRATLIQHPKNRGKGAALQTALESATGRFSTILDADLEYGVDDLNHLLKPLIEGSADVVYGTRAFSSHTAFSFWYVVGNKAVTLATNVLYNCWLSDIMTCHKAMSTEMFRGLELRESGFAIEAEITARTVSSGVRIHEVPIVYTARGRDEGKKLTALDGLRVLRTLVRCRVDNRLPLSRS